MRAWRFWILSSLATTPTKRQDGPAVKFADLRLKEITNGRIQTRRSLLRIRIPLWSVFFSPAINLTKAFEFYCRSQSLFFFLAFPLDVLAMCTFISLNILETPLAVPYGIKLRSCSAAMCGASCFPCHVLSPFYLLLMVWLCPHSFQWSIYEIYSFQ